MLAAGYDVKQLDSADLVGIASGRTQSPGYRMQISQVMQGKAILSFF